MEGSPGYWMSMLKPDRSKENSDTPTYLYLIKVWINYNN